MTWLLILTGLGLLFNFLSGIQGSSSVVATMISSRALAPRQALGITAIAKFIGPFLFGMAVAQTVAHDVADPQAIDLPVLVAALLSAITWNLVTWWLGLPSSSSHALFGGIFGAVLMKAGWGAVRLDGLSNILIALFSSPILGLAAGFIVTKLVFFLARGATPKINTVFKRAQIFTAGILALSQSSNDAQKTMGVMVLGLVIAGRQADFYVPLWVIVLFSAAMALGTAVGGWRLIRTMGAKFYRIRPVDGFSVQFGSALVLLIASLVGGPVSTTQVVGSAILGVGAAERVNKVRWSQAREIAMAWLITLPITGALAAGLYLLLARAPGLGG